MIEFLLLALCFMVFVRFVIEANLASAKKQLEREGRAARKREKAE